MNGLGSFRTALNGTIQIDFTGNLYHWYHVEAGTFSLGYASVQMLLIVGIFESIWDLLCNVAMNHKAGVISWSTHIKPEQALWNANIKLGQFKDVLVSLRYLTIITVSMPEMLRHFILFLPLVGRRGTTWKVGKSRWSSLKQDMKRARVALISFYWILLCLGVKMIFIAFFCHSWTSAVWNILKLHSTAQLFIFLYLYLVLVRH